ncbi:MAG: squalene/phytoene synthase family protein [Candidatus Nanohaloarchaeota archaeon QJJ-9]|nr:squalene/phytoene synthase family protein [Candidatus Nanohaloarchaeota archaeon QJJ-9]
MEERPSVSESREYCMEAIQDVSRTFALGINRLKGDIQDYICVSYLLCRIPDTIEDDNRIEADKKEDLLKKYADIVEEPSYGGINSFLEKARPYRKDGVYWDLLNNTEKVFTAYKEFPSDIKENVSSPIQEMVEGMSSIVERHKDGIRLQDMGEFKEYCHYVAGTVGELLTGIFKEVEGLNRETVKELEEHSEGFGQALQSVNIIKDVYPDFHVENNVYLPEEVLEENGSSLEELEEVLEEVKSPSQGLKDSMDVMIDYATIKLEDAGEYIENLPLEAINARDFTIVPYLLALGTLREARNNMDVFRQEDVKIGKSEVFRILGTVDKAVESNEEFEKIAGEVKRGDI